MTVRSLPPAAQLCGAYEVRSLQLGDGRSLAYAAMGPPLAQAKLVCLYHHGVPASLVEAEPLAAAGAGLGVAVVAFDRPGMGGSTVDPAMSVASVVADAAALLDHLQLAAAVQVGESGGAPYAAAFAALRPERTAQLLLLAGLAATHGRQHRPLRRSLSSMDRWCMSLRALGASHVINSLVKLAANRTPNMVKRGAGGTLGPCDAAFLRGNDAAKDWLLRFTQRAYMNGMRGVLRDYRVLAGDWGVDVGAVQARTAIWHGSGDRIVPPLHAEYYADAIPGSQLRLVEGEGHVSLVGLHGGEILGDVLRWAEARGQPSAEVVEVAAEPVAQPVLRAIEVCA